MSILQLLIKNPSAEDFRVDIEVNQTVGDLKKKLASTYPSNPGIERQKLIHAGKLLQDSAILGEFLKQSGIQIIHLVIAKPSQVPSSPPFPHTNFQTSQNTRDSPNDGTERQRILQEQFLQQQRLAAEQFILLQQQLHANQMAAQRAPPQRNVNPQPDDPAHRESYFWLFIRLFFMVYLFSQGGSNTRTVLLSLGAFFIFLYQIGVFRIAILGQNAEQQGPPAPGGRGFIQEFIIPFFYSLLPTWQPNSHQEAPAPVPPQPGVDAVDQVVN